jgi:hypothetical protein
MIDSLVHEKRISVFHSKIWESQASWKQNIQIQILKCKALVFALSNIDKKTSIFCRVQPLKFCIAKFLEFVWLSE